ncbi:PREDICTED: probable autolytic lysozyme [Rhagoletis zephyria]|uniref:probable autolytic lysozyme n=1 Tax=Rhagoletis zephyria TaxID=28612 RepID=UPI00081169E3|nr:PREDICTED: probable autolytic lysozyme [Rhagoletis zephyria]
MQYVRLASKYLVLIPALLFLLLLEIFQLKSYVGKIVDLSNWNENVNFKIAKEDGILGVIHKATQGLKYVDPKYAERRKEAEDLGLLWGAYHFGVGESGGKDQANHFLKTVGETKNTILVLDIEENQNGKNIEPREAEDFVEEVLRMTGRLPLIYGSRYFLEGFSTPTLTKCPLWIAKWGEEPILPKGWSDWILWQYTDGKTAHEVKGIGKCDRDKFNGTLKELKKFWLSGGVCC